MISLSIIILTYNSSKYIEQCIKSVSKFYRKNFDNGNFELIVFDNFSHDETALTAKKTLQSYLPKGTSVIEGRENLGFAKGINAASKKAKGTYLLFLNPDSEIENDGILEMIEFMKKNDKVKVCGGKMVDYSGNVEKSVSKFYKLPNLFFWSIGLEEILNFRTSPSIASKVDYVSGGFMMVERDYFLNLKGFDEDFFMYMEDMEFCYRTKKNGFKVWFLPYARIKHRGQGSSDKSFAISHIFKGIKIFHKKHSSKLTYIIILTMLKYKAIAGIVMGCLMFKRGLVKAYRSALKQM